MTDIRELISDNLDIWTSAIKNKKTVGRGNSKKLELTGIKKLRELILELAVRGKLVQQDPNDEPASVSLEKIATEKERLYQEKKIKKQKTIFDIGEKENLSSLPKGWKWCNLNTLIRIMDAGWSPACPPEPSPSIDKWGVLKTTAVQTMEYRQKENKVLAESKIPKPHSKKSRQSNGSL